MTAADDYSGSDYWDDYHATSIKAGLNQGNKERKWVTCFLPTLEDHRARHVLDLGCGSGYDALELARRGFEVTGIDISPEAIKHARDQARKEDLRVRFEAQDVAEPLPFPGARFDAVVSNLTLHMFPEPVARRVVVEVRRCLKSGGLFLFHVNSTSDIPYRAARQPPAVRLGPNFYRLGKGQTMRFFSETCCRDLLAGWTLRRLEHVENRGPDGEILKCAWRCIAQNP